MLPDNKVIITVAVNGGMQQDREGCVVPKQPAEIGEAAARAYEAGAAMVHSHARDKDRTNSGGELQRFLRGSVAPQHAVRGDRKPSAAGIRPVCRARDKLVRAVRGRLAAALFIPPVRGGGL